MFLAFSVRFSPYLFHLACQFSASPYLFLVLLFSSSLSLASSPSPKFHLYAFILSPFSPHHIFIYIPSVILLLFFLFFCLRLSVFCACSTSLRVWRTVVASILLYRSSIRNLCSHFTETLVQPPLQFSKSPLHQCLHVHIDHVCQITISSYAYLFLHHLFPLFLFSASLCPFHLHSFLLFLFSASLCLSSSFLPTLLILCLFHLHSFLLFLFSASLCLLLFLVQCLHFFSVSLS